MEVFNLDGPDIDAELIVLTWRLSGELGIRDAVTLELNSLGTEAKPARVIVAALVEYLSSRLSELDEDSRRRLKSNPLRVLDSKNADTQAVLVDAPEAGGLPGRRVRVHQGLKARPGCCRDSLRDQPKLVRGLDYYSKTVFEWVTDKLGAQGTVCAGGRYDGLVEQMGGKPTTGVGFAMGIERLITARNP